MEGHSPPMELLPGDAAHARGPVATQTHHLQSGRDYFASSGKPYHVLLYDVDFYFLAFLTALN
jgi:hypothetical protein